MRRSTWTGIGCGVIAVIAVLAITFRRPIAMAIAQGRSTSQFAATRDPRVFVEPGAEPLAAAVIAALPEAITTVERGLGRPFAIPIRIYVCAGVASFVDYGADPRAAALTTNHRIFVSPKPENTAARMPRVVAHELAHLNLAQQRSRLHYTTLPVWFDEGLAVEVSGGGGAEDVDARTAWQTIAAGRTFSPDASETVLARHGAATYGLTEHLFYREAGLFVGYLRERDPIAFAALIAAVEDGADLGAAVEDGYGTTLSSMFESFRSRAEQLER